MTHIDAIKYFNAGYNVLSKYVNHINKINVFPIPDKDTGTNMEKTMRVFSFPVQDIPSQILYEARGSSGNILAIFFISFFHNFVEDCSINFKNGYEGIMSIIENPKEGTIISLIKVCSKVEYINDKQYFNDCMYRCIIEWLDGPNKLDVLKKYNTYDSGALGFLFILDGINQYLNNKSYINEILSILEDIEVYELYDCCNQYCLEFNIDTELSKENLQSFGNEIFCIKGENHTHVHIHTDVPDIVLKSVEQKGTITDIKIDQN